METALLLHNIRSAHNVGSIFRTADAAGVSRVFLSGYTPRPTNRFGMKEPMIAKTALGAELSLPWVHYASPAAVLRKLKHEGWQVVGIEQDGRAIDYRSFRPQGKTLYILGNEVSGISPALRKKCDVIVEIPMRGKKESLNVSVAAGIVLFACQ